MRSCTKLRARHVPFNGDKLLENSSDGPARLREAPSGWWADSILAAMGREPGKADLRGLHAAALYAFREN